MWRLPERRARAVTLIEVLVASVLAAVIGGIILDLMISMRARCARSEDRLAMQSQARLAGDTAVSILEAAVRPSALDPSAANAPLVFQPGQCAVISSKDFDGKNFYLWTIRNEKDADTGRDRIQWFTSTFDVNRIAGAPHPKTGLAGLDSARFSTKVAFRYATQIDSVATDAFRESLKESNEYPKIVRIEIVVEDLKKELKPTNWVACVRIP